MINNLFKAKFLLAYLSMELYVYACSFTLDLSERLKVTYVSRTLIPTASALVMASTYSESAASVSGPKYVPTPKDETVRSPAASV